MNASHDETTAKQTRELLEAEQRRSRQAFERASLSVPTTRVRRERDLRTLSVERDVSDELERHRSVEYLSVKSELHQRLLDELDERNLLGSREDELTDFISQFVAGVLAAEPVPLNESERSRLTDDLLEETLGVGPLAPLMADPAVSDILVNGPDQVYIERFGRLEATDVRFRDAEHLVRIIQRIAARVGRRVDESSPMVDARLPDGSRVNATIPPVTIDGPTLSIRRFGRYRLRRSELIGFGMLSSNMAQFLEYLVRGRKNLLISGGTGAGKSTFLGALAESIQRADHHD
jgi:pilus assembly protein CpaF